MSDFISSFQCFVGDGPTGVVFGHQRAPQRSRPNVTPEKVLRRSFYSFFFWLVLYTVVSLENVNKIAYFKLC